MRKHYSKNLVDLGSATATTKGSDVLNNPDILTGQRIKQNGLDRG